MARLSLPHPRLIRKHRAQTRRWASAGAAARLGTSVFLAKRGAARYQVRAFSGEPTGFGTNFPMPDENASKWSAAIAQLVEHVIRNDGVTGSSPVCGTIISPNT
jgi:hypothetical protein